MRIISLFFFILGSLCLNAQDRPIFLPEDIEATTFNEKCYCSPGVINKSRSRGLDISFLQMANSSFNEEEGFPLNGPESEQALHQLSFKLRLPIVNKESLKVLVGVIYRNEKYSFKNIGSDYNNVFKHISDRPLRSSGIEAAISKSWNDKFYSALRIRMLANGDFGGIYTSSSQYTIYNVSGLFGVKKNDNREWALGLNFSHSFRSTVVLPFFIYNHTFNAKWGIEMVLPSMVLGRYNLSQQSILLLGVRYNSRSYAIKTEDLLPQRYDLNHSEMRLALTLEQSLGAWIWIDATAGLQYNFSTDFDAANDAATSFQVEPGTAPFFKIGLFVSPSDKFLGK